MVSFGGEGDRLIAGRYRLGARLARGGMGTVWRATDELLGREVAVKELRLDDGLSEQEARARRERTFREARTVAQLHHPGVIVVHDVVEQDERPWIVMELVDGRSLAEQLASEGPVPPREAARIGLALLGALRTAHAHGVLHRDLKPSNVLMEAAGGRVVLTDFGVAQFTGGTTITEAGSFVGTPEYTAPERMSGGRVGPESDLWSLGALLCTVLTGASPFHRDSLGGVVHAVVTGEIHPPEAARPLLPVVRGLLERDPDLRLDAAQAERLLSEYLRTGRMPAVTQHATGHAAGHVAGALAGALAGQGEGGRPPPFGGMRARTGLAAALIVVSAAAAGVAAVAMLVDGGHGDGPGGAGPTATAGRTVPPASATAPTSPTSPTATAASTRTATGPAAPGAPDGTSGPPAPKGYHTVSDGAGFRVAVPDGYARTADPPRVLYSSPGRAVRIGVHIQDAVPGGPLSALRQADAEGPRRYAGYRGGRVAATTHDGHRAALWEFTWDGAASDRGPRRMCDLSWEEGGRTYDVWVSAPYAERAEGRRHFKTALTTFTVTRPSS